MGLAVPQPLRRLAASMSIQQLPGAQEIAETAQGACGRTDATRGGASAPPGPAAGSPRAGASPARCGTAGTTALGPPVAGLAAADSASGLRLDAATQRFRAPARGGPVWPRSRPRARPPPHFFIGRRSTAAVPTHHPDRGRADLPELFSPGGYSRQERLRHVVLWGTNNTFVLISMPVASESEPRSERMGFAPPRGSGWRAAFRSRRANAGVARNPGHPDVGARGIGARQSRATGRPPTLTIWSANGRRSARISRAVAGSTRHSRSAAAM